MSAKWVRSKKWDDQHLTGVLTPLRWLLRAFSSIPLAVCLLVLVAFYGILASVPLGIIALSATWALYAATLVLAVVLGAGVPVWLGGRGLHRAGIGPAPRFVISLLLLIGLAVAAAAAWYLFLWPLLHYRPATLGEGGEWHGIRFFGDFIDRYQSVQFRRLPMMEMSELEFYAWWPLRLVLVLFVIDMVVTTMRRIEFTFVNIGVLTVHSGIVTLALGSAVYGTLKQEGDMLLQAGPPDSTGEPTPGSAERGFYDNTRIAIWAQQSPVPDGSPGGWEQRPLDWLPRYHDYNLAAAGPGTNGFEQHPALRDLGPVSIDAPIATPDMAQRAVADDLTFRVVGYSPYATLTARWVVPPDGRPSATDGPATSGGTRMREVEAFLTVPDAQGGSDTRPQKTYRFLPDFAAQRAEVLDVFGVEYTRGMDPRRWSELTTLLPRGTQHALVVEHPGTGFRSIYPVKVGQRLSVGDTGFELEVRSLDAAPPFPIITRGYQGATSSVAVVRVVPPQPTEADGAKPVAFDRWVYHRYPEISQDLLDQLNERGMPVRRDADPALKITYIDASILQVYLDERVAGEGVGSVRAIVRFPGGEATVTESLRPGDLLQVAPSLRLKLGLRSDNASLVEAPLAVPPEEQAKADIGTHKRAAVAVQVGLSSDASFERIVWLPFTQYMGIGSETERSVDLPDGRRVTLAFGRVWHQLPFEVRLTKFHMDPYPHSDTPRDYRSDVLVMSRWGGVYQDRERKTSLNEPLLVRVPFIPRDDVPAPVNWAGRLWSLIIPNQYKFAQAGWDAQGWRESKARAEAGQGPKPHARFTILGVGNNPGIYVIAAGAIMMSVGIPWAFYVKPAILRYRKGKIQRKLGAGGKAGPQRAPSGHQEHKADGAVEGAQI